MDRGFQNRIFRAINREQNKSVPASDAELFERIKDDEPKYIRRFFEYLKLTPQGNEVGEVIAIRLLNLDEQEVQDLIRTLITKQGDVNNNSIIIRDLTPHEALQILSNTPPLEIIKMLHREFARSDYGTGKRWQKNLGERIMNENGYVNQFRIEARRAKNRGEFVGWLERQVEVLIDLNGLGGYIAKPHSNWTFLLSAYKDSP